jgi:hypothetical protein
MTGWGGLPVGKMQNARLQFVLRCPAEAGNNNAICSVMYTGGGMCVCRVNSSAKSANPGLTKVDLMANIYYG